MDSVVRDGMVVCTQTELLPLDEDRTISFGPLSCAITDLFRDGFILKAEYPQRKVLRGYGVKIYLQRGSERYLAGKSTEVRLKVEYSLVRLSFRKGTVRYMDAHEFKQHALDTLAETYPVRKRNRLLLGNQTPAEYVTSRLGA